MPGGTFIYLYFTRPYGKELTVNVWEGPGPLKMREVSG